MQIKTLAVLALMIGSLGTLNLGTASAARGEGSLKEVVSQVSTAGRDYYIGFEIADNDDVYLIGVFDTTVDLDPTAGVDTHVPIGSQSLFLTKINADNTYGWSRSWGTTGLDHVNDLAIDSNGNLYVVGQVGNGSVDFDRDGAGDIQTVTSFSGAGFLMKINADGSYNSTQLLDDTSFAAVETDSMNNVIVGGALTNTVDFDFGIGVDSIASNGNTDGFVAKYDASMNYVFSRAFGGTSYDYVHAVAVDSNDDIIYGGGFSDTVDLDPTAGVQSATIGFSYGAYFTKLTSTGDFSFAKTYGSIINLSDTVKRIITDADNNIIIGGHISGSTDLDSDNPGGEVTAVDTMDIVTAKYSPTGVISYAGVHPSNGLVNTTLGISLDSAGNLFVSADTSPGTKDYDPTSGVHEITTSGILDSYVTRINADNTYGGTFTIDSVDAAYNAVADIRISNSNTLYALGSYSGTDTDLDPGSGATIVTGNGDLDGFLAEYDFTTYFNVAGLPSGMSITDLATSNDIADSSSGGLQENTASDVQISMNGVPLGRATLQLNADVDWSGLAGESNESTYSSVIDGLSGAPGVVGTHSLYVPKRTTDTGVLICPAASVLSAVTTGCEGAQFLSEANDNVSSVEVDGKQYWLVSGLSGTGGMSLSSDEFLAATGSNSYIFPFTGAVIFLATLYIALISNSQRRNKSSHV